MEAPILLLGTDYAGTVSYLGIETARKLQDIKKRIEESLNVKLVWVLISGTISSSMKIYVEEFNNTLKYCDENAEYDGFVELGFAKNGGHVFSEKYTSEQLQELKLVNNKSQCFKNVIEFYKKTHGEVFTALYGGDGKNDIEVFNSLKELNIESFKIPPAGLAPYNAEICIMDMADFVSRFENIEGILDCLDQWLKLVIRDQLVINK
ncbi:MAG: hypothetical protein N2749_00040 [Clostridia bacterium]|nr:hypothetical protein [Clostridia bacterium]